MATGKRYEARAFGVGSGMPMDPRGRSNENLVHGMSSTKARAFSIAIMSVRLT